MSPGGYRSATRTTINDTETGDTKRLIIVDPASDKYVAKDRTGRLDLLIETDFTKIVDGVQKTLSTRGLLGSASIGKSRANESSR